MGARAVACVQGLVALFATWELRSCEWLKKLLRSIAEMSVSYCSFLLWSALSELWSKRVSSACEVARE